MFVTFEGIEGSGKSTLLRALGDALAARGHSVLATREPGGTPTGDRVRAVFLEPNLTILPLAEALLINASRAHLVNDVIRPELARGTAVLCDRFIDSTIAYQGYGRGLDVRMVRGLCDAATGGLLPDVTFYIDIPVRVSRMRVASRADGGSHHPDRIDQSDDAFYERVRAGYATLVGADPKRIRTLDGTRSQETLLDAAMSELGALLR